MSDRYVLHSSIKCPFSMRVRIVLELKNISYTVREERIGDWSEFLQKNVENPRIPILIHNGSIIRESNLINEYLEKQVPAPRLVPSDPQLNDEMRQWWNWCDHLFRPAIKQYKYTADQDFHDQGKENVIKLLNAFEGELGKNPNLCGQRLTLADIAVFPFVYHITEMDVDPVDFSAYPKISVWLDQIRKAPYFKERVMKKYPFVKETAEKS